MVRSDSGSGVAALLLFVLAMGAFFVLSGLLLVFSAAAVLGVNPDTGQLWAFGGTVSGVVVLVAWLVRGPIFALGWYPAACLAAVWLLAFAFWGLHQEWPHEFISQAIPGLRG